MAERNRREQRLARARMAETGENYTTALRAIREQKELTAAEALNELRQQGPPDLGCAYGAHDWRYDVPSPGMKTCVGRCGGVYST